ERQGVRHDLDRRVRRLAVRRARARRGPRADARRRLAVGDPAEGRAPRGLGGDRRAALRDLHRRLARRHLPLLAAAHPARRHPADLPALRAGPRGRRGGGPGAPRRRRGGRRRRAADRSRRRREGRDERRRARRLRGGHHAPVRAGRRVPRRRAPPRAQRGPGRPLDLPPRLRAHRQRVGRLPDRADGRARPPAGLDGHPRQRRRDDRPRLRQVLPADADRRGGDRRGAQRHRAGVLRPARPAGARALRGGRPALPAADRPALRRDPRGRLPAAVHPLLPHDEGVLRARPRPAEPGRRRHRQRGAPGGLRRPRAGPLRDGRQRLPERDARPDRGRQHARRRLRGPRVGRQGAGGGRAAPARAPAARGRRHRPARAAAARRRGLHGRPRAGGVADRQVDRLLRRRRV
ncbi:MAG: Spermidine synthase, partial [uncultured Solirubrobacteraceae bacterium]